MRARPAPLPGEPSTVRVDSLHFRLLSKRAALRPWHGQVSRLRLAAPTYKALQLNVTRTLLHAANDSEAAALVAADLRARRSMGRGVRSDLVRERDHDHSAIAQIMEHSSPCAFGSE